MKKSPSELSDFMDSLPKIYYSHGGFLVYSKRDALNLREKRILGSHIGCSPKTPYQVVISGLPYKINDYAISVVLEEGIGEFRRFVSSNSIDIVNNERKFSQKLETLKRESRESFVETRTNELKKRRLELTSDRVGEFDDQKLRLDVPNTPDDDYTSFETILMSKIEVQCLLNVDDDKRIVFRDLYIRGFFVTMGMKFGCDFLAYIGDPVRYHAQYAVRVLKNKDGKIDMAKINYQEMNALQRLCHTANKTPLFTIVLGEHQNPKKVEYFTLRLREYLTPLSDGAIFQPVDPAVKTE